MITLRFATTLLAAGLAVGLLAPSAALGQTQGNFRLGPTTLRDCDSMDPADPVNVGFVGTHASWQNSQRLVGKDGDGPELMWRTTTGLAGGVQSIMNGAACTKMNAQSVRGFGLRGDEANTKRHTRFFEQTTAYTLNSDATLRSILTGQDAHRDVKRRPCRGPGSAGSVNDAVPARLDGSGLTGYDSAQRLFLQAFPSRKSRVRRGPAQMRFVQCGGEQPPRRYSVGWNGNVQTFRVDGFEPCQGDWSGFRTLGRCPTERGREGTVK